MSISESKRQNSISCPVSRLSYERLSAHLSGEGLPEIKLLGTVGSTNSYARSYAEYGDIPENGIIFATEEQTAGRGRLGRSFLSDRRGIYISYLFKPRLSPDKAIHATTLAAVAAARAIEAVSQADIKIKWVNDLMIGRKKLAGILTEGVFDEGGKAFRYAIIGIGINLYSKDFPEELREIATSLEAECGCAPDVNLLLARLAAELSAAAQPNDGYIEEYRCRSAVVGKRVSVLTSPPYTAQVLGIGEGGELLLRTDTGEKLTLSTGEISIRLTE